jgi:hypothetical protein
VSDEGIDFQDFNESAVVRVWGSSQGVDEKNVVRAKD